MSKYDPLQAFLTRRGAPITFALDELNLLVPGGLPHSAFEHESWWNDDSGHPQSQAWQHAGFRADVDLTRGQVRFVPLHSGHLGTAIHCAI